MIPLPYYCSEKNIKAFADAVIDNTAEPEYKSAPIPEEPTDGGVTIIVGKNFDSIVKDAEKDVLLEVCFLAASHVGLFTWVSHDGSSWAVMVEGVALSTWL